MSLPIKDSNDRYQIYIGGWRPSTGSSTYPNRNPAHKNRALGSVVECDPKEVDIAMHAAQNAFPAWRAVSGNIKTKVFLHVAQILYRDYDSVCAAMTREMGKTLFDAKLDLDEAIGVAEAVAPQGLSLKGETYQKNTDGIVMESRLEPRGVAAIITPFNFPIAIPLAQIVAALVTGNTVVWKPSHLIPESSQIIVAAIVEAMDWAADRFRVSLPSAVLSMVTGDEATGKAVISHPIPKAVSFTGSKPVGDAVDAAASALGKRVMKEVGGINIFYVHKSADIGRAARNFVYGKTITAGQRCTSIQEVLIDRDVYEKFVDAAVAQADGIRAGDGADPKIAWLDGSGGLYSLPPLVSEEQQKRVERLIAQSTAQGATIRFQRDTPPQIASEGYYAPFTILEDVGPDNVLYSTEIFGPAAVFTPVDGIAEAIETTNAKIGIVACIDATDKDATETFLQNVLRTRVDDGRHGTGAFWATRFGGDRGAGSGNPALDENMVYGYVLWKTIYRAYRPVA